MSLSVQLSLRKNYTSYQTVLYQLVTFNFMYWLTDWHAIINDMTSASKFVLIIIEQHWVAISVWTNTWTLKSLREKIKTCYIVGCAWPDKSKYGSRIQGHSGHQIRMLVQKACGFCMPSGSEMKRWHVAIQCHSGNRIRVVFLENIDVLRSIRIWN